MHKLLRGWRLYLLLGLLTVVLYWRFSPKVLSHHALDDQPQMASAEQTLEWWPKDLDAAKLTRLLQEQPHLGALFSTLSLIITGLTLGGILATGWGMATGRIRLLWRFVSPGISPWTAGELIRIVLLTVIMASLMPFVHLAVLSQHPDRLPNPHAWVSGSMALLDLFLILTILAFAKGREGWRQPGFFPARTLWASIAVGLRSYLTAFPWLFLSLFAVVQAARRFGFQPPVEPIQELVFNERQPEVLALTVVLACVIGPVAEELLFRGVLYAVIRRRASALIAMLASGAMFALIHTNILGFVPIMLLGCLLAYVYERTGSLAGSLAVHMFHNSLLMGMAIVFRQLLPAG